MINYRRLPFLQAILLLLLMMSMPLTQASTTTTPYNSDAAIMPEIVSVDEQTKPLAKQTNIIVDRLDNIDFRRTTTGGAKLILNLPDDKTAITVQKQGKNLHIHIAASLTKYAKKRLNLRDFATAATFLEVQTQGSKTDIYLYMHEDMTYTEYRHGYQYTIRLAIPNKPRPSTQSTSKQFTGKKLSLSFQDIEVRSVLQILAEFTQKNIAVSDSVTGSITLNLKDIPWDQALDVILKTKDLSLRENNNVLWIAPAKEMAEKEQAALEAEQRKQTLKPLLTETIAINFAKAKNLATLLKEPKGDTLLSARGSVSVDERTNTLLVQDIAPQVTAIRQLINTLDVPVKQVLIESRIVVANNNFSKELGTKFGITSALSHQNNLLSMSGSNAATAAMTQSENSNLLNSDRITQVDLPDLNDRLSVNLPTLGAAGSLGFAILSKGFLLDLELSALQAESKGEVIATPRVITLNQHTAKIEQGVQIPYQKVGQNDSVSIVFKKAVLSMDVTPQITPTNHIVIDLKVHQDTVGQIFANVPSINTRAVQTKVLVEHGQTIVLGGVHEESNVYANTKVPVLGDIPVVGRLFKKTQRQDNKRELLIFLTPKIISHF